MQQVSSNSRAGAYDFACLRLKHFLRFRLASVYRHSGSRSTAFLVRFFFLFFTCTIPRLLSRKVNCGVCSWWGYQHSAHLRSRRCHSGCAPKERKNRQGQRERKRARESYGQGARSKEQDDWQSSTPPCIVHCNNDRYAAGLLASQHTLDLKI